MKKIIVIGYPKSGNTWLTRLTAELVDCPVEGFLYSGHKEIAVEGRNRVSNFRVYKSHHQFHELKNEDLQSSKLIYVIRDPRDISISGRSYFSLNIIPKINYSTENFFIKSLNLMIGSFNRLIKKIIGKEGIRKMMNKALLYGNSKVHRYVKVSWKKHITPFIENNDVLKVKYESLLNDPIEESKKILKFIDIEKDDNEIQNAIDNQSFSKVKQRFIKEVKPSKANFLRKGKSQQWKTVFSEEENKLFTDVLNKELTELGYDLN